MALTMNKQRLVNQLFSQLGSDQEEAASPRPLLEEFVYALLREGNPREAADLAFAALKADFFDWNEVRVSMVEELTAAFGDRLHDGLSRAQRVIDFLQEVFEANFSFDLDGLDKKGLKQANKSLARFQAATPFAIAWVTQKSLGGHAIPLDEASIRALRRLGIVEDGPTDLEAIRASIEHQIPKAKGEEFVAALGRLTAEFCHDESPACGPCPLKASCPTGQTYKPTKASKKPR